MNKENKNKFNKIIIIMFALFLFGISSVQTVEATLTDGLDPFYNPAETNNWLDLSGNGNDGLPQGGQTGTFFDGVDDHILTQSIAGGKSAVTISAWINPTTVTGINPITANWAQGINEHLFRIGDGMLQFYIETNTGTYSISEQSISAGVYQHVVAVYDGSTIKTYINGVSSTSTSATGTILIDGETNSIGKYGSTYYSGNMDNFALYNRGLSESEVLELYNKGGLPVDEQQSAQTEQTYSQSQLSNIAINDTDWHTITAGNFTIALNDTINYGEAIVYATSTTDNMILKCRTNLDGVNGTVETPLILQNGSVKSNILLRNNVTLLAGVHTIELECKNEIIGNTVIGASVGIGHIMKTAEGEDINYKNHQFANTVNSGATFTQIGSTTFTANESLTDFKYVLVDWSAQINNTHNQDQTISVYPRIENVINNKNCEQNIQFIPAGEFVTAGGVCILNVNELLTNTISLHGTGIAIDYEANFNIKEFDYATINETKTNILTGITSNSSTFVEKASTTFTSGISNAEVIVKGSISATSSTNDILYGRIIVEDEASTVIYQSKDIAMNTNSDSNDFTFQTITPIMSGTNTFKLLLRSSTGNLVTIDSGEINGYVTQKLDITDNSFEIKAFEFWNGTQLSNFSAVIGSTTYSTTGNTINAIGQTPFQDILINKETYVSRLYTQHDTTLDLNASIGQNRLDLRATESYTNNGISNFTLETEIGDFSTTNGLITLYPFAGIYNWNITTDTYFNKTNEEFQVGGSLTEITRTNFYDSVLTFQDELAATIYPTCSWLGNTLNEQTGYNISIQQSLGNNITCNIPGFASITNDFSLFNVPFLNLFTMNKTEININIYDRDTNNLITTASTVTVIGPVESTQIVTLTGTAQIKNISFTSGEYQILVSNTNYVSEIVYFTYDNQQDIQQDIYMVPTVNPNKGVVIIKVIDEQSARIENVLVKVQEWRNQTSSFVTVGQAKTGGDGTAQLNIELGTKVYRFTATLDDVFVSSINQVIYNTGETRTLTLPTSVKSTETYLDHIITDIIVENIAGTNLSKATFTFEDTNNLVYESCIELYEVNGFIKSKIEEECVTSAGSTLFLVFDTNKTFSQQLLFTMKIEGQTLTIDDSNFFKGNIDISSLLTKYNLHLFIPLLFCLLGLVIGLYTRNIYISIIALIITTWISNSITPDILTKELSAVITVFLLIGLWGGSRK